MQSQEIPTDDRNLEIARTLLSYPPSGPYILYLCTVIQIMPYGL